MITAMRRAALVGALVLGGGLLLAPTASATEAEPDGCPPDTWYQVSQYGAASYEAIGSPSGKYNSSNSTETLRYDLTTTTSKSTTWSAEAGGSVGWGIATVQAKTSYSVTKQTTSGKTLSNTINVPSHKYGYTTPKIERRVFNIEKYQDTARCTPRDLGSVGKLHAITAYPFFSECTAASTCTPKP
ncbi:MULTISPECIES: hypothetical protein [Kitasatospora]|uniref:Secreted protein n=2 Tax=Kitasatospora TaxID=2063 RepID=A0ABT1IXN3_9ACTN|nr:hypothetical protein [Kitasatospora paracochleata]MCP2309704.1 hypothetical protein [Kitasatospora paracochleata]